MSAEVSAPAGMTESYGLHAAVLGPVETLAQSVSAAAPSTSPSLTIPLVIAPADVAGETMYDWRGSLAVFGFLIAYALVAVALPFARRAVGQHSHAMAAASIVTVLALALIATFDLHSTADAQHARIPWTYLSYIALGIAWSVLKLRRKAA